jgi:glutamyl-tRNA synthetase
MTFWRAQERCRERGGRLILRIEDLDPDRCRPEFREAVMEDLRWFGLRWDEGPYLQSERRAFYREAFEKLRADGHVYACNCSRRDVMNAAVAPHGEWSRRGPSREASHQNDEPIYPGTCRPSHVVAAAVSGSRSLGSAAETAAATTNWRFRVPDGEAMQFIDGNFGLQQAIAGKDFGDFLLWRKDDVPAYQLAVVVDDAAMEISEVVRGADLLVSTFRQLLIYRTLGLCAPEFFHVPLITNAEGKRLSKRDEALSLRTLREAGADPEDLRARNL